MAGSWKKFILNDDSVYIGTTAVALNRASGPLTLAGITLTTPNIGAATGTSLDLTGGNLDLDKTTNANQFGLITKAGDRFIHDFNYGDNGTVTTTGFNVFIGINAGNLTMGSTATSVFQSSHNIGIGGGTLLSNTKGYRNIAIGNNSLTNNTIGYSNVGVGLDTLGNNTEGYYNLAIGYLALYGNTTGYYNTAIGLNAGRYIADGSTPNQTSTYSFYLGSATKANANGDTNETVIGYNAIGAGSNTVVLGNTSVTKTVLRGNIYLSAVADRATTAGTNVINIFNGTAPVGTLTNGCSIYSSGGELYTMDAAGNATLQTPHDKGYWIFKSTNTVTGKTLIIDVEKMLRKLNEKFGWDFVHDLMEES